MFLCSPGSGVAGAVLAGTVVGASPVDVGTNDGVDVSPTLCTNNDGVNARTVDEGITGSPGVREGEYVKDCGCAVRKGLAETEAEGAGFGLEVMGFGLEVMGFGLEVMIPEGLTEEANRGVPTISDLIKG